MWTGIPVFKLTEAETKKLIRMEEELHKRVIGQEVAITAVSKAIRRSRAGIKDPKRPAGSFIFLGPSGVGKTELARTLADFLFGDEEAMIRIDMSEYMEKHAVSRLVGSPPGYIGYDEGGQLTEAVRRKPYSVLLLDEIEKAHPDVFNILLQILEDGRLTDAQGRTVDFRNAIVIMTSNIGASEISKNTSIGFTVSDETGMSYDDMKNRIMSDLKKVFRPEFLNRIDEVIVFHKLAKDEVKEIIDLMITRVRVQVAEHELQLELTEEAKDLLVEKGWDPSMGARPLRRAIQRYIEDPLADEVLRQGEMTPGSTVMVARDASGDEEDKPLSLEIIAPKKPKAKAAEKPEPREGRRRRQAGRRRAAGPRTTVPTTAGDGSQNLSRATAGERARPHARSAPGAAGASSTSARRSRRSGWSRCCAPGAGSTPSSPPTPTGRARPTGCSAGRWRACRARSYSLVGAVGHDFYEGERERPERLPALHRPARCAGPTSTRSYLRMATEASLERIGADSLRPAAAPQPRPHRLLQRGRLGRDGGAARGRADGADRRRAGAGQRLHPRPDRLPRALRRPDRLGDGHPQPARALARRALPRRRRAPRGQGADPRRRLRRPLLGRPAAGDGAGRVRPPQLPSRRAGSRPGSRSSTSCCRSPNGPS